MLVGWRWAMSEFTVVDWPERSRYELRDGDEVAGFVKYDRHPDHLDLVHTEILPAFEGRGLGGRLVAGILADVRAKGGRIVASCPFVARYLTKHPEHADLEVGRPG
jgi:predicted GNAT family acetyltransferase